MDRDVYKHTLPTCRAGIGVRIEQNTKVSYEPSPASEPRQHVEYQSKKRIEQCIALSFESLSYMFGI